MKIKKKSSWKEIPPFPQTRRQYESGSYSKFSTKLFSVHETVLNNNYGSTNTFTDDILAIISRVFLSLPTVCNPNETLYVPNTLHAPVTPSDSVSYDII